MFKSRLPLILTALLAASLPLHLTSCGSGGEPNSDSGGGGGDGGGDGGGGGGGSGGGGGGSGGGGNPDNEGSLLGMGLAEVASWTTQRPWVDVFRTSEPWMPQRPGEWDTNEPLDLRPDGYPRTLPSGGWAGSVVLSGNKGHYPAGNYVCLYDGTGKIEFGWAGSVVSSAPGRMVVRVTPANDGVWIRLVETDRNDPIHNIRFILPGFESTYQDEPWHPEFLARWREFKILRFQEWLRTNGSEVRAWSDRTPPGYQTEAGHTGVAWETIIDLANRAGIDPWICIPHQASDDYIEKLAILFRDRLDPELTVYLEYSNEVWNGGFEQHWWAGDEGLRLGLDTDQWSAALKFFSQRSVFIFDTFERVFGGRDRIHRALAAQSANEWTSTIILEWRNAYEKADSIAIAPYFAGSFGDPSDAGSISRWSVDRMLDEAEATLGRSADDIRKHLAVAAPLGVKLTGYEGGQHMVGYLGAENNQALTDLFMAANRHPRMEQIYDKYLKVWQDGGGDMFVLFNSTMSYSKWGSWGTFEYADQTESSPAAGKYRSMLNFIRANK